MAETTYEGRVRGSGETARGDSDTFVEEATVRDRVWDATLTLLADRPIPFKSWRVRRRAQLDESHERTIRRTLTVMAEAGWLDHEHGSKWWYPGPRVKEEFDVHR